MPVYIEGRLKSNSWQSTDGTKKSRLEVVASRVQFLVRIEGQNSVPQQQINNVEGNEQEYVSDSDAIDEEDVPF